MLKSNRNIPLVYQGRILDKPVLTVELYEKWYSYHLVQPTGEVVALSFELDLNFHKLAEKTIPTLSAIDHTPFPLMYKAICLANDYYEDELSYQLVLGRWTDERGGLGNGPEPELLDEKDWRSPNPVREYTASEVRGVNLKLDNNSFSGAFGQPQPYVDYPSLLKDVNKGEVNDE